MSGDVGGNGFNDVPQGSNGEGVMWDGGMVVVPVDGVTPLSTEVYPWVDEVQVAVELPMGPVGPEGPAPSFDVVEVLFAQAGTEPDVDLELNETSGVWEFTFLVPQGPVGPPGAPLNVINAGPFGSAGELPLVNNAVGDAYRVVDATTGKMDLYVWGCTGTGSSRVCSFSKITGWQGADGADGAPGVPGKAYVGLTEPEGKAVGDVWFNSSADGYVPTNLRVDEKLILGGGGGALWGQSGGGVSIGKKFGTSFAEKVSVTDDYGLNAVKVSIQNRLALSAESTDGVLLGASGVKVHASTPLSTDPNSLVATKEYADKMLPLAGGEMTGHVVVKTPEADGNPVNKKWWDDRLLYGKVGDLPGQLATGHFYFGYD